MAVTYQNQAVHDAAVAALAGRQDIATFVAKVEAMGPGCEAWVGVNSCVRYWTPGTPANFSLYVGLKDARGWNVLSYNGGGETVETAIAEADAYLRRFIAEKVADPSFCYSEEDVAARRAELGLGPYVAPRPVPRQGAWRP